MIEAKYILSLCDRFEPYLVPLDIHVLRQRYNSQTFKSTYTVGRAMGISDETVRTIENRALDAIAHCLDLETAGQAITPTRLAKSFKQLVASSICDGGTHWVSTAAYTAHRGELIIFASSIPMERSPFSDPLHRPLHHSETGQEYPTGAIVGRCLLVVDCSRDLLPVPSRHKWRLTLRQPEAFPDPIPYSGQPSSFDVNHAVAQPLPTRDACALKRA
jgi:hypothetical protein